MWKWRKNRDYTSIFLLLSSQYWKETDSWGWEVVSAEQGRLPHNREGRCMGFASCRWMHFFYQNGVMCFEGKTVTTNILGRKAIMIILLSIWMFCCVWTIYLQTTSLPLYEGPLEYIGARSGKIKLIIQHLGIQIPSLYTQNPDMNKLEEKVDS